MKTTIDLPEELLRRAKIRAAEQGSTLKELVVHGLRIVTQAVPEEQEQARRKRITALLAKMNAGNTEPMNPLSREQCHER